MIDEILIIARWPDPFGPDEDPYFYELVFGCPCIQDRKKVRVEIIDVNGPMDIIQLPKTPVSPQETGTLKSSDVETKVGTLTKARQEFARMEMQRVLTLLEEQAFEDAYEYVRNLLAS